MSRRILWINPVMTNAYDAVMSEALRAEAREDTLLDVASFDGDGPHHLEFNAYEMLVAPRVMETIVWAQDDGYDAAVIGCFYDPFVRGAKELSSRMAVTAPAEACLRLAQSLGERISIVVGRRKWIPEMEENVHRYGAERNLASFRVLEMGVEEFQVDPALTEKRIREQAEAAVRDDRADVVILGCTIEFGFYRSLQDELGVPVVDATVAPLLYAELLADAGRQQGWRTSAALGYGTPSVGEYDRFLRGRAPSLTLDPRRTS